MRRNLIAINILLLSACTVGPRYETPVTVFAEQFSEIIDNQGLSVDLKTWWTQFNDPILNAIIDEAIVNNYDLQMAGARIAEVRARYNLASANLWPEIDLTAEAMRSRVSQTLFDSPFMGPPIQNFFQAGFDASWELDFFGRLKSIKKAALFDLEASQENFRNVYITLLAEVSLNYSTLRALQKQIAITYKQIETNEERLNMGAVRYSAGLQAEIEPLQLNAELVDLKAQLPPLEAQKKEALYNIAYLLGRQPESIPVEWLTETPIPQAEGKIPLGLPSDLLRQRPDIRQAERQLAAASSRINASMAQLFPTFSLNGSFGYQSDRTNNLFSFKSETWSVAPSLFWPAIDFGRIRSEIDFTKSAQKKALLNYEQTIIQALVDVEESLSFFTNEEIRLKQLQQRVNSLVQSEKLTKALYEAGLQSYSTFLNAKSQVLLAQQDLIASEKQLSQYLIAVYKSLGGDWPCSSTP